jgi:hypothetical protein
MTKLIITSGSGPSYSKWAFWPLWTKLLPFTHRCKVIDVSGPAAGNKFISRSVITELYKSQPDLVMVQWNFGKFDIYSENSEFLKSVREGAGIRNFIVDLHTCTTTDGPGYWCSSYDNTHPWKRYYNETIRSDIGTAMDDLEAMLNLQNLCAKKNIPYRFFTHSQVEHELLSTNLNTRPFYNEIDWNLQIFNDSVDEMYKFHPSRHLHVRVPGNGRWVPNADFSCHLLTEKISPALVKLGIDPRGDWKKLQEFCKKQAEEIYEKYREHQ